MKILSALLVASLALSIPAISQEKPAPAAPATPAKPAPLEAKVVTADEAEKLIKDTPGLIILDVRTPEEFDHQHIKGAVNVNVFDPEFEKQIAALDQTKPVLVHCQAGGRSAESLEQMAGKVKFPQIYHMQVGMKGWKDAKKPLEVKPLPGAGRLAPGQKAPEKEAK